MNLVISDLMTVFGVQPSNLRISKKEFKDKDCPLLKLVMYLYSLETPLYLAVNRAKNDMDITKLDTLGPFDFIFTAILSYAASQSIERIDSNRDTQWLTVYRGATLTKS